MSSDRCAAKKRDLNNCENNNTLVLDVTVDINDICDGALQVIKRIRPLWKINDIKFKVCVSYLKTATNRDTPLSDERSALLSSSFCSFCVLFTLC